MNTATTLCALADPTPLSQDHLGRLPWAPPAYPEALLETDPDCSAPADTDGSILCIEDDPETAAILEKELTGRGYRVSVAYNAGDGFASILADRPDLVVCDLSTPIMSGFDVLERLARLGLHLQSMPFVFLTAVTNRDNDLRGRQLSAGDYVAKPIDFEVLDNIIRARLVQFARIALWRRDINLTAREIEVLTWSARGKTSHEIAQIVFLTRRTVDFHLDNIRAKFGTATRIETVAAAVAAHLIAL